MGPIRGKLVAGLYYAIRRPIHAATMAGFVDAHLATKYDTEDGRVLQIRPACIDSGGHYTKAVYDFVRPRKAGGFCDQRYGWGKPSDSNEAVPKQHREDQIVYAGR